MNLFKAASLATLFFRVRWSLLHCLTLAFFYRSRRIHMHVISTDFDSGALKHPKHWLSFTTDFFLDAAPLIAHLETTGRLPDFSNDPEAEDALDKGNLPCPLCKEDFGRGRKGLSNLRLHYHQQHYEKGERLTYPL